MWCPSASMARNAALVVASAVLLLSPTCFALIDTTSVSTAGVSATLLAEPFGFAAGGYMDFEVELAGRSSSTSYIVVLAESVTADYFASLIGANHLEEEDPPAVCVAPSTGRFEVRGSGSFNLSIARHDMYSAYLVQCHRGAVFSGDVTTTFLNLSPEGGLTQHLAIQHAMLPALFTVMSVVYVALTAVWIGEMLRLRLHVLPVHFLCLVCVLVKAVQTILVAVYYHRQSAEGNGRDSVLGAARVLFISLFQVMFLLTLLLFSLGWGFIRQSLRSKEGWLVTITIAFYAGVALIDAGCSSTGTSSNWCSGVSLLEYAVRSLIMLSTVVAINFNITHIRFCIQLPWTSSSALEYLKLSRYLAYRMTFLAYLLWPTVLLMIHVFILSWEYEWLIDALQEFVMFLIVAHLGVTFGPLDPWLFTRAFDHSLEQGDNVVATAR
eukprot:g8701.t1